jgi:hypothetical protein
MKGQNLKLFIEFNSELQKYMKNESLFKRFLYVQTVSRIAIISITQNARYLFQLILLSFQFFARRNNGYFCQLKSKVHRCIFFFFFQFLCFFAK